MAIQFLDSRISNFSIVDDPEQGVPVPTEPLLIGDIGLQTFAVLGTPNQSDIRVQLMGTIGVNVRSDANVTVYIERGGNGTFGSGTIIFTAQGDLPQRAGTARLLNLTAGDFPSAEDAASGQIRYTMFIARNSKAPVRITGPINFMGTAAAGNSG